MKVLVTGHNGYIGSVMVRSLQAAGHEVVGLDTYFFADCTFGPPSPDPVALRMDIRDVQPAHVQGFDAIIHLAALCNDPLGTSTRPPRTRSTTGRRSASRVQPRRRASRASCSRRHAACTG